MKFMAIAAMVASGLDSILMATGAEHQSIFSANYIWLWWIPAIGWFVNAIAMCFATVEMP
jgi:hypothetical protein